MGSQAALSFQCLQLISSPFEARVLSLLVPKCRTLSFLLFNFILFLLLRSKRSSSASYVLSTSMRSELKCLRLSP